MEDDVRTQGRELFAAIKSMRAFLGDVSQLMVTAEALMGESSWEPIWGTASCTADMSYSISGGRKWMPREAARPYVNAEAYPRIVALVAVLLDDDGRDYRIDEPVVSASYFVFPETDGEWEPRLDFWNAKWFGWCKPGLDGTPGSRDSQHPKWQASYGWTYMQVFGRPLVEIADETKLKELIVDPLLGLVEDHASQSGGH